MRLGKDEWDRWARSISKVEDDLQATVNDRELFHGFRDVLVENREWIEQHEGVLFCDFVVRSYVARVALGIRRQVKRHDDSISLVQILSQMKECAPQLTFDFYLEQFPREPRNYIPWQEPTFASISEDGRVASTQLISSDIDELTRLTGQVEGWADRELAHLDRRGFIGSVTYDDLDAAVNALDRIACKYICLLTGRGYETLKATIVFDWRKIFSVPLRKPS
jgi:hypothetical protein